MNASDTGVGFVRRRFATVSAQAAALLLLCFLVNPRAVAQEGNLAWSAIGKTDSISEQTLSSETNYATLRLAPSVELAYQSQQSQFHLRGRGADLVRQVLGTFGIDALVSDLDDQRMISFDTEPVGYQLAADMIQLATASLIVPLDSTHALVARNTKQNRLDQIQMPTETLYFPALSAAELQDVSNIAANIFSVKQVTMQPVSKTILIRAPESTLLALNATLVDLFADRSEIALEFRLYETDKSRSVNRGVQLPQSSTAFNVDSELNSAIQQNASAVKEIISSGLASASDTVGIVAILVEEGLVGGVLSNPFALFGGGLTETGISFGSLTANLSLDSSDTRQLQQALIKVEENQPATFKVGSRYPIETSSYTGAYYSASGKVSSQTTPQISYEDIGLILKVTPRLDAGGRIHLAIEMKVQALQGTSINGLPVLTSRSLASQTAIREGSSTTLTSVLVNSATGSLSQLPGLDAISTDKSRQDSVTELAVVITPHLLRKQHVYNAGPVILLTLPD